MEDWEKTDLLKLLNIANYQLGNYTGGSSKDFNSTEQFQRVLKEEINDLEFNNQKSFMNIWYWFSPNSTWEEFVDEEDINLGKQIFTLVNKWKLENNVADNIPLKTSSNGFNFKKLIKQLFFLGLIIIILGIIMFFYMLNHLV